MLEIVLLLVCKQACSLRTLFIQKMQLPKLSTNSVGLLFQKMFVIISNRRWVIHFFLAHTSHQGDAEDRLCPPWLQIIFSYSSLTFAAPEIFHHSTMTFWVVFAPPLPYPLTAIGTGSPRYLPYPGSQVRKTAVTFVTALRGMGQIHMFLVRCFCSLHSKCSR